MFSLQQEHSPETFHHTHNFVFSYAKKITSNNKKKLISSLESVRIRYIFFRY